MEQLPSFEVCYNHGKMKSPLASLGRVVTGSPHHDQTLIIVRSPKYIQKHKIFS
jgi:hypothetical protein